jgi:hypothetical protein
MECPRFWREMPINTNFSGKERKAGKELTVFKYPGGEIRLNGTFEEIQQRIISKGFTEESTNEILFYLFGAVASESPIPLGELVESFNELLGSKVGK